MNRKWKSLLPRSNDPTVYVLTLILAACSILYELVIAQSMALLAANTVVWYSVTVGLYLLGMGLGSFLSDKILDRFGPWQPLICVELLLTLIGGLVVLAIHCSHMLFLYYYTWDSVATGAWIFFGCSFLLILCVGILTGIELPLLMRAGGDGDLQVTSAVLGLDYVGSLIGSLIFPLILLPRFELLGISFGVAAVNLLAATVIAFRHRRALPVSVAYAFTIVCLTGSLFVGVKNYDTIQQYFLKKYYYYLEASDSIESLFASMPDFPEVFRASSPYQKIDLMEDVADEIDYHVVRAFSNKFEKEPNYPQKHMLFLNGDFQINTSLDEIYHEYFAHVPIFLRGELPKDVLVLGGGDGLLISELLKHRSLQIQHLDLDAVLIDLAKNNEFFRLINNSSFRSDRVHSTLGDGYQYMRNEDRQYDAIYVDFPMPADYNLAKLYSREFFWFIRKRLKEGGYLVFDATGIGLLSYPDSNGQQDLVDGNDWPIYYNTLRAAGFSNEEIVPYLTTMELENDKVDPILREAGIQNLVTSDIVSMLNAAQTAEERRVVEQMVARAASRQVVSDFRVGLQQGFIVAVKGKNYFKGGFTQPDFPLYVLNEKRFELAFSIPFPKEDAIDITKVNSILRPTFPTIPLWQPRTPF